MQAFGSGGGICAFSVLRQPPFLGFESVTVTVAAVEVSDPTPSAFQILV